MEYAVSVDSTTLVTLHAGSDTTARDDATEQLTVRLAELETDESIADWAISDAEVYEHPTAPFEPYTIAVAFAVTVTVDADDAGEAAAVGEREIDDVLELAGFDAVSYASAPDVIAS